IIKNSAVAMTIAITDLMFYSQKIEEETFAGFEAYTAGTLLFLLLTLLTVGTISLLQRLFGLKVRTAGLRARDGLVLELARYSRQSGVLRGRIPADAGDLRAGVDRMLGLRGRLRRHAPLVAAMALLPGSGDHRDHPRHPRAHVRRVGLFPERAADRLCSQPVLGGGVGARHPSRRLPC